MNADNTVVFNPRLSLVSSAAWISSQVLTRACSGELQVAAQNDTPGVTAG